jgi:DNA-binding MarR family transcriptional regulator
VTSPEPCESQLTATGGIDGPWQLRDDGSGIPEDAPLPVLMLTAARLMGAFYGETVRAAGVKLSPAGLGVLRLLVARDGRKTSEVSASGGSSPGTTTAVVNTLVREGYVKRFHDPVDRRVIRLHVTDKGRAASAEYTTVAGPLWGHAFDFVSAEDEPVVRKFFTDMITKFAKLAREERGA